MRPLRVLFVANDGLSTGHVVRMLALARELARRAVPTARVLATTSQAHALLATADAAIVALPAPVAARAAGLDDTGRRRLVRGAIDAVVEAFAPDLVVVDTFPEGPHGEVPRGGAFRKVLVRRATLRPSEGAAAAGLAGCALAIACEEDPGTGDIPTVAVPPITLFEASEALPRAEARAHLGLPADGELFLVTGGGGGDAEARAAARDLARRLAPARVVLAEGPLAPRAEVDGVLRVTTTPLQPLLAAFDGAFAAAGYNTAYELAKAGVPTVLRALPRPFDDQAARAARLAERGWALVTDDLDAGLAFLRAPRARPAVPAGGAARAVDALLRLVGGAT